MQTINSFLFFESRIVGIILLQNHLVLFAFIALTLSEMIRQDSQWERNSSALISLPKYSLIVYVMHETAFRQLLCRYT